MLHSLRILLLLKEFIFFFSLLIRHPHGGSGCLKDARWKVLKVHGSVMVRSGRYWRLRVLAWWFLLEVRR